MDYRAFRRHWHGKRLGKLAVATNTTQLARTGTVVIAGATFTIEQAGAQPCSYTIDLRPSPDDVRRGARRVGRCDDQPVQVKVRLGRQCPGGRRPSPVPVRRTITEGAAGRLRGPDQMR